MIILSLKKAFFKYKIIWFSKSPDICSIISFSEFRQCESLNSKKGFLRLPFYTSHINLMNDIKEIFASFDKNTKYEVNRAIRDGVQFEINKNQEDFINFYNEFAKNKNREKISKRDLELYASHLLITSATHENIALVMHSYVVDNDGKRVRLLHSASSFRSAFLTSEKALIGRANRFLHYSDIVYLKNRGYCIYDFGGVDLGSTNTEATKISKFKFGFGGVVVTESNFISYPLALWIIIRSKIFS